MLKESKTEETIDFAVITFIVISILFGQVPWPHVAKPMISST